MNEKIQRKLQELSQWDNEIRIPLPQEFTLLRPGKAIPDGWYLTLRVRKGLIYQFVNEMKDGKWKGDILDGSETIMYRDVPDRFYGIMREIQELQKEEKEKQDNSINKEEQK